MYSGKYSKKSNHISKRAALLVFSLVMILSVTVGGTLAYLIMSTGDVTNTFTPGDVTTTTEETFTGDVKENVQISNEKSNLDVAVRAKVVIAWVDKDGNVLAEKPVPNTEYNIEYDKTGWIQGEDGYWYCNKIVKAGEKSPVLIQSCYPEKGKGPVNASFQVTILSQSIQATEKALEDAHWAHMPATN